MIKPVKLCVPCARADMGTSRSALKWASAVTRWSRPCTSDGPSIAVASCIIPTGVRKTDSTGRRNTQRLEVVTMARRRDDQRPLRGGTHSPARTLAELRGGRVRHADLRRLVQPSPAAGAYRQHPAGRGRVTLLRHAGRASHRSRAQTKRPPANPGRFRPRSATSSVTMSRMVNSGSSAIRASRLRPGRRCRRSRPMRGSARRPPGSCSSTADPELTG